MTDRPRAKERELRLLVEDFWASRPGPPPGGSRVIPIDGPPLRFLLSEYDLKLAEGAAQVRPEDNLPPDPDSPRLQLLAESFDPATRYPGPLRSLPEIPVDGQIDFETHWGDPELGPRWGRARLGSAALHVAMIAILVAQPHIERTHEPADPESQRDYTQITLLAPSQQLLEELSRGQDSEDRIFRGDDEAAQSGVTRLTQPVPAPPAPEVDQPAPPQPLELEPTPDPEPPKPAAEDPEPEGTPEPPEAASPNPNDFQRGREIARLEKPAEPPAAPKPAEKPKLILEDPKATMPGRPDDRVTLGTLGINQRPSQVIESAIEQMKTQGGGRQAIGDGVGASPNAGYLPPSPGNIGSGVELMTDPKGVDFRPYLTQILNAVRRNWYAVIPESARLGMERGRVAIQFIVVKNGDVPKLVIASTSSSQPLDRAAVAGISASLPLPPLPAEFTGDEIKLQFVFLYNMRR